jgi:hypothetical protein
VAAAKVSYVTADADLAGVALLARVALLTRTPRQG